VQRIYRRCQSMALKDINEILDKNPIQHAVSKNILGLDLLLNYPLAAKPRVTKKVRYHVSKVKVPKVVPNPFRQRGVRRV
jgi:hypothetical protein